MRWLFNYLRQCLCAHAWKIAECNYVLRDDFNQPTKRGPVVSATCTKCGYHRSYWKFDP